MLREGEYDGDDNRVCGGVLGRLRSLLFSGRSLSHGFAGAGLLVSIPELATGSSAAPILAYVRSK